jgi:GWxTD domain-containing protein
MIRIRWFFPALLLPLIFLPVFAAKLPLTVAIDGYAEPVRGDSARVTITAQVDSLRGAALGPLLLSIRARDGRGHTLLSKERVSPVPADTTLSRQITWAFHSGAGKVRVQVRAKTLDFDGAGDGEFEMDVPRFSKEAFPVSTIRIGVLDPDGNVHVQPSHRFQAGKDRLAIDLETASADSNGSLEVRYVLRRQSKVVQDSSFVGPRANGAIRLEENTARWGSGQYAFQITLTSAQGSVRRAGEFQIAAGGVDLLRDPVLVRTVLAYVATGEERQAIETAPTDSLSAVWDRFWTRRDPSPGTGANEALDRFLDRVNQATNRFGGVVPGWKSDRGRILIQHGTPERTERTFDQSTRTETEIWYYDLRNMSYVFQDPEGFGNYKLTGGQ